MLARTRPRSTLFPATTLFRSAGRQLLKVAVERVLVEGDEDIDLVAVVDRFLGGDAQAEVRVAATDDGLVTVVSVNALALDRKSTRLNSSPLGMSYAVFCLKKN